jgi:hypothetical protein
MDGGELVLDQQFQMVSGTVRTSAGSAQIENGVLRGEEITFTAGGNQFTGRVTGDRMEGTVKTGTGERPWSAARKRS